MLLNLCRKCNCKRKLASGKGGSDGLIRDQQLVIAFVEACWNWKNNASLRTFCGDGRGYERFATGILNLQKENRIGAARSGGDVKEKIKALMRLNFD